MDKLIYLMLMIIVSISKCSAYFITVDAHAEECFFDKVEAGTKMGECAIHFCLLTLHWKSVISVALTFEIAEGGFLDIDVRIIGPDGKNIYQGERETSGKYGFAAHTSGVYTYCFSNKMSTMTPKVVMFNMAVGESPKTESQDGETANKLEEMIRDLSCKWQWQFCLIILLAVILRVNLIIIFQ